MKTSRACTGMLSPKNDDFKFLKTVKNINSMCITCIIVPGLMVLFYLSKSSHRAASYRNLDTVNYSLTLSIFVVTALAPFCI